MCTTREPGQSGEDPPTLRVLLRLVPEKSAPAWFTAWLALALGSLVLLGWLAGPWVPGALSAAGGITAVGRAIARARARSPETTKSLSPVP